jgi:hypothetical protein
VSKLCPPGLLLVVVEVRLIIVTISWVFCPQVLVVFPFRWVSFLTVLALSFLTALAIIVSTIRWIFFLAALIWMWIRVGGHSCWRGPDRVVVRVEGVIGGGRIIIDGVIIGSDGCVVGGEIGIMVIVDFIRGVDEFKTVSVGE